MSAATHYLSTAEQLFAYAQTQSYADALPSIELAIASLEMYLYLPPTATTIEGELRARFFLANILKDYTTDVRSAEEVLSKGFLKMGNQEQFIVWRLAYNELLANICIDTRAINVAKRLTKDSLTICNERGEILDDWNYRFLFRAFEIESTLSSVRGIRSLAALRGHPRMIQMANLLDSCVYISQGIPIPDSVLPQLTKDMDNIPTESLGMIDYIQLSLSILGDVLAGNVAKSNVLEENCRRAIPKLGIIHKGLDADPNIETTIQITISATKTLEFDTFSTRRFMIFMYLLSGVVHVADVTSSRSEKFLAEGLKQLTQEIGEFGMHDFWIRNTKINLHLYRLITFMLRSKLDAAQQELDELSTMSFRSDFSIFLAGALAQLKGDLDSALGMYSAIREDGLFALAMLNKLLILRGSAKPDLIEAREIEQRLGPLCMAGALKAAYSLVTSISPGASSIATKRIITSVLNTSRTLANTQLNYLGLSILAVRSADPDDMCLKFSSFASSQASKSASGSDSVNIWTKFNGDIIETLYAKSGNTEKLAKMKELNSKNAELVRSKLPLVYSSLSHFPKTDEALHQ